ncbi:MAG: beta-lactamase family protein [Holophagales bacterium]|nr:beta-lactamase family protein [Holophagales bacterium]
MRVTSTTALIFVGALAATLAAPAAAGGGDRGALLERIDGLVSDSMEATQTPGISVAVQHRGELILARGYGLADVENRVPATEHTVYRIGSVTKQFTAAAVMKLVEQGKVALDDPMTKHFPDYPVGEFHITVGQLLDHTSGIKGYTEMPAFWEQGRLDLSHEQMIELFSAEPYEFEPGDRYQYNNSGYYLAGLLVEKASGKSYAEYLEETFFRPLGMRESHYLYNDPIVPNRAEGYRVEDGVLLNDEPLSMHLPFAAGALGSSVLDLVRWMVALGAGDVVGPDGLEAMTTRRRLPRGEEIGYGLGLFVGEMAGHRLIEHAGGINGFLSQLAWYPDDDLIVAVLANSRSAEPGPLQARIARAVLGVPEPDYAPVALEEDELQRYAGVYDFGRNPLPVQIEDGKLQIFGRETVPIGEHRFVGTRDQDQMAVFEVDSETGAATHLRLERWGQVQRGQRAGAEP